jgi:hypothetical protein
MHECGRGLGNVNHVYDSDGYCWYREHRGDGGWSVERCEHIVHFRHSSTDGDGSVADVGFNCWRFGNHYYWYELRQWFNGDCWWFGLYERDCCFGDVDYVYDSDGYCWYCECCGDFWWSVKRREHVVHLQRAVDNHDCASNDCASNDCSSSDDGS